MSLNALRTSIRKAALPATRAPRVFRNTATRRYSTEVPPKKSNTALFAGLGAAAVGGIALYVYTSSSDSAKEAGTALKSGAQSAKALANFVPSKEDYQKVGS